MITFTMAEAGPATVRVFDARGRLVRQLHDGWLDNGRQDLPWSGDDDDGRPAASGVYLVQARAGGRVETARVTVVR
jgi:flagellar hook assembly protein FlgD